MSHLDRHAPGTVRHRRWISLIAVTLVATIVGIVAILNTSADAAPATSGGWTTSATAAPASVAPGAQVSIAVAVRTTMSTSALVDLEIGTGSARVMQRFWDRE